MYQCSFKQKTVNKMRFKILLVTNLGTKTIRLNRCSKGVSNNLLSLMSFFSQFLLINGYKSKGLTHLYL